MDDQGFIAWMKEHPLWLLVLMGAVWVYTQLNRRSRE